MFYVQYNNKLYSTTAVLDNKNLQASHSKIENKNYLQIKEAGIDVGTNNIAAIFINDEITPSLIVDGRKYKDYNFKFNQLIAGLNKNKMIQCAKERKKIKKIIYSLYEKRDKYLKNQFFKIAKRIAEYLYLKKFRMENEAIYCVQNKTFPKKFLVTMNFIYIMKTK